MIPLTKPVKNNEEQKAKLLEQAKMQENKINNIINQDESPDKKKSKNKKVKVESASPYDNSDNKFLNASIGEED